MAFLLIVSPQVLYYSKTKYIPPVLVFRERKLIKFSLERERDRQRQRQRQRQKASCARERERERESLLRTSTYLNKWFEDSKV